MLIKTSKLTGAALDWAVRQCTKAYSPMWCYSPSTDWAHGGPIIELEGIELKYLVYDKPPYWGAIKINPTTHGREGGIGPTPLIAAMRCFVASKMGETVDIPDELKE